MSILDRIFPIPLYCDGKGWSENRFQLAMRSVLPKGLYWFGYDTIILSPTEVEFVVYGIRDSVWGGLGDEIARIKANVNKVLTEEYIESRIQYLARERRDKELRDAEESTIQKYADEVRAALLAQVDAVSA